MGMMNSVIGALTAAVLSGSKRGSKNPEPANPGLQKYKLTNTTAAERVLENARLKRLNKRK
jgi:hypothetical protein